MTEQFKSWFEANHALAIFLAGQAVALVAALIGLATYLARLETRVGTIETRGAAFTIERLGAVDTRLTALEHKSAAQAASIERIVDTLLGDKSFKLQSDDQSPHPISPDR